MWRPLIQICGTVRRPLFWTISARRAGSRSTRIFSTATPFCCSSRSAEWQNGHEAVRYISTFAMSLFDGQPGLAPRAKAARKAHDLAEALAFQRRHCLARAITVVAVDDERLVLALGGNFRADGVDARQR